MWENTSSHKKKILNHFNCVLCGISSNVLILNGICNRCGILGSLDKIGGLLENWEIIAIFAAPKIGIRLINNYLQ